MVVDGVCIALDSRSFREASYSVGGRDSGARRGGGEGAGERGREKGERRFLAASTPKDCYTRLPQPTGP